MTVRAAVVVLASVFVSSLPATAAAQVVADFAATQTSGAEALSVAFQNLSTGATNYQWSFGDGGSSSDVDPVHVYEAPGTYSVSLFASGPGFDVETKPGFVTVSPASLSPQVVATSAVTGSPPLAVSFVDGDPGGQAQSWHWEFGDGGTSDGPAPGHVYLVPGTYDVTLATGAGTASATTAARGIVTVTPPTVMAPAVDATPRFASAPATVTLRYAGTGAEPDAFHWAFSDGATSTERDPVHVFANPGAYDVLLTTTLGGVTEAVLVPDEVVLTPSALAFGDGTTYEAPGVIATWVADATGDGLPDVVGIGSAIAVWPGFGDGSLGPYVASPVVESLSKSQAALVDLDGDGRLDVAGASPFLDFMPSSVWTYRGEAGGVFVPVAEFELDAGAASFAVGDLVEDGVPDAFAATYVSTRILVGDGAAGFTWQIPVTLAGKPADVGPHGAQLGDLDDDGHLDVVVRWLHWDFPSDPDTFAVFRGNGAGGLAPACTAVVPPTAGLIKMLVADVDDDDVPEIVSLWSGTLCADDAPGPVLRVDGWGDGCPHWSPCSDMNMVLPFTVGLTVVSSFDGMGGVDIAGSTGQPGECCQTAVLLGTGGGVFAVGPGLPNTIFPTTAGDLDGDGFAELVSTPPGTGTIRVHRNETPPPHWTDLGGGLAGAFGVPALAGAGGSRGGLEVQLSLSDGPPFAPAILVAGLAAAAQPFKGGTLLPSLDMVASTVTDGAGAFILGGLWPDVLGPGFTSYWQAWVADPGAPAGAAATAALRHVMPSP